MKRGYTLIAACLVSIIGFCQIPNGYYDSANGLTGENLREELHQIIKGHTSISYSSIKSTHHETTDKKSNGKVWDMYSDVPGGTPSYTFTFGTDACGNYATEGDCYNREHSFPQSWFSSANPMQTDLFHVYATDGYVNGQRASHPYGNVASATWTSTNGSKLGSSGTAGYSGTVFEPIDEYKGDFARTYFYMVTRYKDIASGWTSDMLTGNDLSDWATDLLVDWSDNDPVSTKETDRNNAVYGIQNNRNPYIDDPQFITSIWGGGIVDTSGNDTTTKSIVELSSFDFSFQNGVIEIDNVSISNSKLQIVSIIGRELFSYDLIQAENIIQVKLETGIYIAVVNGVGKKFVVR